MVPTAIATAIRSSTVSIARLRIAWRKATVNVTTSCRKYEMAAISVPACRATSKVLLNASLSSRNV